MPLIHSLKISPPLLNSSCPWASDEVQLRALFDSQFTGAVTTRTATVSGFQETSNHTVAFHASSLTTLNSYGYSPHTLVQYKEWVRKIIEENPASDKPFIISITSTYPDVVTQMVDSVQELRHALGDQDKQFARIGIELNTSCPNIAGQPPPSYEPLALKQLISALSSATKHDKTLSVGVKLPPYVHEGQILDVVKVLEGVTKDGSRIAFLTCTNTLGNCVFFGNQADGSKVTLPNNSLYALSSKFGGMAGEFLHPLALGNVQSFRSHLDASVVPGVNDIALVGVGGVTDKAAGLRMQQAGASVVGCASALGRHGPEVFERL